MFKCHICLSGKKLQHLPTKTLLDFRDNNVVHTENIDEFILKQVVTSGVPYFKFRHLQRAMKTITLEETT